MIETLEHMKAFLANQPGFALATLLLFALWRLFRKYDKIREEQIEMNKQTAVLADKMCRTIRRVAAFAERWID
jgi:hypothetical protein